MNAYEAKRVAKRALVALLALCLSTMMLPAAAFASIDGTTYEIEIDATEADVPNQDYGKVISVTQPAVGVKAAEGHTAEATFENVNAGIGNAATIVADTNGQATVTCNTVRSGTGDAVSIYANGGAQVTATAGDIEGLLGHGANIEAYGSGEKPTTVTMTANDILARKGVNVSAMEGAQVEFKAGTVIAEGSSLRAENGGKVTATFTKVSGGTLKPQESPDQDALSLYVENGGQLDILVTDSIYGSGAGIQLSDMQSAEGINLTVWQIKKSENGDYVIGEDMDTFVASINYIVKVGMQGGIETAATDAAGATDSEPLTGNLRAAKNAAGEKLDTSRGYNVAHEGDKVYLVVDPGFKITAASNNGETQEVQQDADGNYFIVVKRGGGIDLAATVEAVVYNVVFADEDGTQLQSTKESYGATPMYKGTTPTKAADGKYTYEFNGWAPALSAVTADITYKATYVATEIPTPTPTPTPPTPTPTPTPDPEQPSDNPPAAPKTASSSSMPQTSDSAPLLPITGVLLLAACALGVSRTELRPKHSGRHAR